MSSNGNAFCSLCEYKLKDFLILSRNQEKLLTFLYAHKLLPPRRICECGNVMSLYNGVFTCCKSYKSSNRKKSKSNHCNKNVSQLKGTFFEKFQLQNEIICDFIAFWCLISPLKQDFLMNQLKISSNVVVDLLREMRKVCEIEVKGKWEKFGGQGVTVQIILVQVGKTKDNNGKVKGIKCSLVGMEIGSKKVFVEHTKICNAKKLLLTIKKYILAQTTVVSDLWNSYNCLESEDFQRVTVDQSISFAFVDMSNNKTKNMNPVLRETKANISRFTNKKFPSQGHLFEFLYRYLFLKEDDKRIHNIFTSIGEVYTTTSFASSIEEDDDCSLSIESVYSEVANEIEIKEENESICFEEEEVEVDFFLKAEMPSDETSISLSNLNSKNSTKTRTRRRTTIPSKKNFRSIQQILDESHKT